MRRWMCAIFALLLFSGGVARAAEKPDVSRPAEFVFGAMEVYAWFEMSTLGVDYSLGNEENNLFRVLDERFNTLEALTSYARTYFSKEIVEELFAWDTYTEIDGYLYCDGHWRAVDPRIADVEFDPAQISAEEIVLPVTVYYLDDGKGSSEPELLWFILKEEEGQWVFTDFPFFW